jgi:hypothetical protein
MQKQQNAVKAATNKKKMEKEKSARLLLVRLAINKMNQFIMRKQIERALEVAKLTQFSRDEMAKIPAVTL